MIDQVPYSTLATLRMMNAHLLSEMIEMDECQAIRDEAFAMIDSAPGRDVPPTAWRVAILHAITPIATEQEVTKLMILSRLIGFAVGMVDWDHVVCRMTLWRSSQCSTDD